MWWYHWICWLLSASGVICILVAHDHYSIDVVIGYIACTRTFWWYHTMANSHVGAHAWKYYVYLYYIFRVEWLEAISNQFDPVES